MYTLPAGLLWEEELHREVELGQLTGAVRREILSTQAKRPEAYKLYRKVLKRVVKRIGKIEPVTDEHLLALPFCDVEYILYELAKSLRGDKPFKVEGTCRECRTSNSYQIEWDEVRVRPLEETKFYPDRKLAFTLVHGLENKRTGVVGKRGFFKLYTLGDFENLIRTNMANVKNVTDVDPGRIEAMAILAFLDSIEGFDPTEDGAFVIEDLDRLHLRDYEILATAINNEEPGVFLPERTCPNCLSPDVRLSNDWINFFVRM